MKYVYNMFSFFPFWDFFRTHSIVLRTDAHTHTGMNINMNRTEVNRIDLIQWILTTQKTSTLSSFDCPFWAKASNRHDQLKSNRKYLRAKQTQSTSFLIIETGRAQTTSVCKCLTYYSHAYNIAFFWIGIFSYFLFSSTTWTLFCLLAILKSRKCCT